MLNLLAFTLLIGRQEPDFQKKISFETNAARVPAVLESLSAAAGYSLVSSPELLNDVVLIRVEDVALGDLMKKLAAATTGKWLQEEGRLRLVRDQDGVKAEELRLLRQRTEALRKAQENVRKKVASAPTLTATTADQLVQEGIALRKLFNAEEDYDPKLYQRMDALRKRAPGGRALERMLLLISPERLAAIGPDQRQVFAVNPTPMQLPLGAGAQQVVGDLLREQKAFREAASKVPPPGKNADEEDEYDPIGFLVDQPPDSPIRKVLISVKRTGYSNNLQAEMRFLCEDGTYWGEWSTTLLSDRPEQDAESPQADSKDLPAIKPDDTAVEFGPLGKQIIEWSMSMMSSMESGDMLREWNVPEEIVSAFLQPEKTEPLSILTGDGLLFIARHEKKNLVAALPDNLMMMFGYTRAPSQVTIRQFKAFLGMSRDLVQDEADGWWTILPRDPTESRATRVDRSSLGALCRTAHSTGHIGLDDLAAFAIKNAEGSESSLMFSLMLVMGPRATMINMSPDWNMLQIYGALNSYQRSVLGRGDAINLASLTPAQRQALHRMVYYGESGFQMEDEDEMAAPVPIGEVPSMVGGDVWMMEEPTESLPNGIPGTGLLSVKVTSRPTFFPTGGIAAMMYGGGLSMNNLAMFIAMKDSPAAQEQEGEAFAIKSVRVGQSLVYDFTFAFTDKLNTKKRLTDKQVDQKSPSYALTDLPEPWKSEVEKLAAGYRESFKNMKPEYMPRPGRQNPPPPKP
jgi:hypothetical protein